MFSSDWKTWPEEVRKGWEENRLDYYRVIHGLRECATVKIDLRNLADAAVEAAIGAEEVRALNHRKSAVLYQGVEDEFLPHESEVLIEIKREDWLTSRIVSLNTRRDTLLASTKTQEGIAMCHRLTATAENRLKRIKANGDWARDLEREEMRRANLLQ